MSPEPARPSSQPTPRVFICYRREETAAHAGRLYDAMVARFGEGNVFMDLDMAPGVDFVERIPEVVADCQVLIVVMGPSWATVKDDEGGVRIADPEDFVRLEVEAGLRRPEVTPIPVLVSGARMPKREDLPSEVGPITRRNALELSEARWRYDVGRLNSTLDELLADISSRTGTAAAPAPPPAQAQSAGRLLLEGVLVAGVTAYFARRLGQQIDTGEGEAREIAGVILRRGATWALTGAALAVWLALRTRRSDLFRVGLTGLLIGALAGAIGGAIWALPYYLADLEVTTSNWVGLGALAATGGFLGALIGSLWRPPRLEPGLASGLLAGVAFQLVVIATGWESPPHKSMSHLALLFGLQAAVITGLTLATMLALDRRPAGVTPAANSRAVAS